MTGQSIPDRVKRLLTRHLDPDKGGAGDRGPRAIRRDHDPDSVDEAQAVMQSLGGEVWAGDVVQLETEDPTFWGAQTWELSYVVECACIADIGDQTGNFSFSIFFLAPDQGADVLIVEGDLPQTARAYLGTRGPDALTEELRGFWQEYLLASDAQVTYDLATDELGEWTAYAARENGRFWVRHGSSKLVPQTAFSPDGVAYRDFSLYYGDNLGDAGWQLRLLEVGGFGHAFQMEALPLSKLKIWRRERPAGK